MKILKNKKLYKYSTFKIGGTSDFFCEIKSVNDLKEAIKFAKEKSIRYHVIGSGSNILFSDDGFRGLIIKNSILGVNKILETKDKKVYAFGAGCLLDSVIQISFKKKLYGIENLSGIPGTIGGAVVQNSGACGVEIRDILFAVEVFDTKTNKTLIIKNKECFFDYRNSVFKQKTDYVITNVYLNLQKKFTPNLKYLQLKNILGETTKISPSLIRGEILRARAQKVPNWKKEWSAGSYFKNPIVSQGQFEKLVAKYPNLLAFSQNPGLVKISLGYVLDKICHLKSYQRRNVQFYKKNALTLINLGKAKSKDVLYLANLAKKLVKKKLGIEIKEEVLYLK